MMQPLYILSAAAISPQHSFGATGFLDEPVSTADGKLFAIDAEYNKYINPVAIRRMSRMLKMSISAGMAALQQAGVSCPDAIITGTGRGSMIDMERFLNDMIRLKEEALNPTHFIQSTYNSPNGWLAMQTKSNGYNQTYVHRGASLELALLDTQMLLAEHNEPCYVLTGCLDELTQEYFIVKDKVDYWKKNIPESLDLLQHADTPGTIGGEGSAFFTCTNKPGNAICSVIAIRMLEYPEPGAVAAALDILLQDCGIAAADVDIVMAGMNGDSRQQHIYDEGLSVLPETAAVLVFKHLCGEYDTSGGFALWLITQILQRNEVPEVLISRPGRTGRTRYILVLNHYILGNVSMMLLQAMA